MLFSQEVKVGAPENKYVSHLPSGPCGWVISNLKTKKTGANNDFSVSLLTRIKLLCPYLHMPRLSSLYPKHIITAVSQSCSHLVSSYIGGVWWKEMQRGTPPPEYIWITSYYLDDQGVIHQCPRVGRNTPCEVRIDGEWKKAVALYWSTTEEAYLVESTDGNGAGIAWFSGSVIRCHYTSVLAPLDLPLGGSRPGHMEEAGVMGDEVACDDVGNSSLYSHRGIEPHIESLELPAFTMTESPGSIERTKASSDLDIDMDDIRKAWV